VTNAQFAEFLNDALNHPHNERGQYMYFDTVGGGVYVNSAVSGEVGPSASGRQVRMFSPSLAGRMSWGADGYRVADSPIDYSQHPVAGVSWYGALKYCNWLTIDQGLLLQDRCYTEGTDADLTGWRPVTISAADWAQRDLNDTERENLVRGLRGFRLPMDDGADNASPPVDTMDRFNEWFQAAAWNPHSMPPRATTFGFGRNTLTGADANFQNSGDPFDNGTTPVGYFDAVNANAYGLSDMSGNLYQWLQDRYSPHPGNLAFRSIRGGSWNDLIGAASLLAASRTFTRPERVDAQIGFRVLRTLLVPTGDGDGDGDLDGEDMSALVANMGGPGPVEWPVTAAPWTAFDSDSDGDVDLRDVARFQNRYTGPF
jgi:formylglycine-generating enzyme required for sulfatase activity